MVVSPLGSASWTPCCVCWVWPFIWPTASCAASAGAVAFGTAMPPGACAPGCAGVVSVEGFDEHPANSALHKAATMMAVIAVLDEVLFMRSHAPWMYFGAVSVCRPMRLVT